MTMHENGDSLTVGLTGFPPIPHDSMEAEAWISGMTENRRSGLANQGKFIAINDLVLFAAADIPHADVYTQAMHEANPGRDQVLEQVEIIRRQGLATLRSTFVTDAGMFGIYTHSTEDEKSVVELNDKSFYFGRANYAGRLRTVDAVRQRLAATGLENVEVTTIF